MKDRKTIKSILTRLFGKYNYCDRRVSSFSYKWYINNELLKKWFGPHCRMNIDSIRDNPKKQLKLLQKIGNKIIEDEEGVDLSFEIKFLSCYNWSYIRILVSF